MLKKFVEEFDVSDWEIETDDGWVDIKSTNKTIPYKVWRVITKNKCEVMCADRHIVFNERYDEVFVKDLNIGDKIITKDGPSEVVYIEETDDEDNMYDLELADNSKHRYFANDILHHNTTNLGIRTDLCMKLLPGLKLATIVPRMEQLKTIGDKYKEIENANRFKCQSPNARSNLFFKEFPHPGGKVSQLRLWYILTNADKIRGNTYDWLDFDEYQDFDSSLETEILATQSRTKIPMLTFGGTSKSVDTALEEKWINSARGLWRLTCPACKTDNYPTLKYGVMDMIRPKGLCCLKCGRVLNVRDGKWDFEDQYSLNLGRWGFHVPQIIVPANTENESKWLRIYSNAQDTTNFTGFCEEYLGEATEEGSKEISVSDLQRMCTLGDIKDVQRYVFDTKVNSKYSHIVSGCDWGGSDYNPSIKSKTSYTAHVILGVRRDGKFDLLDFTRYSGMDWDSVSLSVAKRHNEFGAYAIANDYGGGAVYINNLRKLMDPFRVIALKYTGPTSNLLSEPKDSNFPGLYSLNKTEAISATFQAIKTGELRAPNWEQCKSALLDVVNLVRVPSESRSGEKTFLYHRKPNKTDDFLDAITYALILGKILQGRPLFIDPRSQASFYNLLSGGAYMRNIVRNNTAKSISI
jgi:hypothetical protein